MDGCGARATVDLFLARQRARYAGGDKGPVAELLAGEDVVVQLADGRAVLGGEPAHRRTAGVYRVAQGRIAEAWLVPLELDAFDAAGVGRSRGDAPWSSFAVCEGCQRESV